MAEKNICILGAGLTGLSAAWHLGRKGIECRLFEKESRPGGLCRSKKVHGFTFDYDGHLLHFKEPGSYDLISSVLGIDLVRHERRAWIYSRGAYTRYPFQANLYGLPDRIKQECVSDFIRAPGRKRMVAAGRMSFYEWARKTFGAGICRHFLMPYNRKFWTIGLKELRSGWVDGFIPVPSTADVLRGACCENRKRWGYNSFFWYPARGGICGLADSLARQITAPHTSMEVRRIDLERRRIYFKNKSCQPFDEVVFTLPLPEIARLVPNLPPRIRAAARTLRWTSVFNINIGVRARTATDKHWIYFPHGDTSFFRVGFFHNFSPSSCPPGTASLYIEVSYSRNKPLYKAGAYGRAVADLREVGILGKKADIIVRDCNDIPYGYIIHDAGCDRARSLLIEYLRGRHIYPAGRYGAWRYYSMEDSLSAGRRIAEEIALTV